MKNFLTKIKKTLSKAEDEISTEERLPMQVTAAEEKTEITASVLEVFCPYCSGQNFVKRGTRQKKRERVQLYLCNDCQRAFTSGAVKGKHYPLPIILDAISLYHLGYSLEQSVKIVNKMMQDSAVAEIANTDVVEQSPKRQGKKGQGTATQTSDNVGNGMLGSGVLQPSSLSNWLKQYGHLCAYGRMRDFGLKMFSPHEVLATASLAHRQLYRYRYHQAKTRLIIEEDFKHRKLWPLKEFLDLVPAECPHEYFQQGLRISEVPIRFSKKDMIVRSKQNYATKIAEFVLGSVKDNKQRHDALQRFMMANDSVTVATEVPVYLRREDLEHMQTQLGFELYSVYPERSHPKGDEAEGSRGKSTGSASIQNKPKTKELKLFNIKDLPRLITGHIDFVQIRNGLIHILDFKAKAAKERPIEQLTLYALALSRLTGLRVFHFKCAWFDQHDYFEFFPLHAVYKPQKMQRRKRVATKEGVYDINKNPDRIEKIKPS